MNVERSLVGKCAPALRLDVLELEVDAPVLEAERANAADALDEAAGRVRREVRVHDQTAEGALDLLGHLAADDQVVQLALPPPLG